MKELSDLTVCIIDHGLCMIPMAKKFAREAKRVLVCNPSWQRGYSKLDDRVIGDGYDNIECIDDFWLVKKEIGLFVFPDLQHAGEQLELESQGFPVWGARLGERQELNRRLFLKTLKSLGLEVPPHTIVNGMDELEALLREKKDCYIKIDRYRGSWETCHWRSWKLDKWLFASWRSKLGPPGDHLPFIVCDKIDTPLEIGADTFSVDGQWPDLMLHGIEGKDKSYLAVVTPREEMPEQLVEVMDAFSPVFKETRSRMQWSMEVRQLGDKSYFTDATTRIGLPSTATQLTNCKNFCTVVYHGAHGILEQPEYEKTYSAEAIITMKGDAQGWGVAEFPKELEQWAMLSTVCQCGDIECFPPDESKSNSIGWLVANGDTADEAIENLKAHADLLPDGCEADVESLSNVLAEIHEEEKQGIEFGKQEIPEPESVL